MPPTSHAAAIDQALQGAALPLAIADRELVALGSELRRTASEGMLDPQVQTNLRAGLLAAHPAAARHQANVHPLHYTTFDTPVGTLLVAYRGVTVVTTDLAVDCGLFERECRARLGESPAYVPEPPAALVRAITAVTEGRRRYPGKLDLSAVPGFQQRVLIETLKIRPGEIRSYGWLARQVGQPGAARAVGTAMAHNPIPILIPCHRVVRSDYHIGEYGCGGPSKKREILTHEGIDVDALERLARAGVRFIGSDTTRIFCVPGCGAGRRLTPLHTQHFTSETQARAAGYRPCKVCKPV